MNREVSNKISMIKLVCAFEIAYFHMNFLSYFDETLLNINTPLQKIGMNIYELMNRFAFYSLAFFFFLTSFLLYYNMTKENMFRKIKSRIFTLVIPYLLWGIIYFVKDLFEGGKPDSVIEIALSVLLGKNIVVLWFLKACIVLLLFIMPFYYLFKNKIIGLIILILSFIGMCNSWSFIPYNHVFDMFSIHEILQYISFYFMGIYLGMHGKKYLFKKKYSIAVSIFAFLVFIFATFVVTNNLVVDNALYLLRPLLVWIFFPNINTWPSWLNVSFFIYITHFGIFKCYTRLFNHYKWFWFGEINWDTVTIWYFLGLRILIGSLCIVTAIVLALVMKRWMPRGYGVLVGNRER